MLHDLQNSSDDRYKSQIQITVLLFIQNNS